MTRRGALAAALVACSGPPATVPAPAPIVSPPPPVVAPPASTWAEATRSPQATGATFDVRELELYASCGTVDGALSRAAHESPKDLEGFLREAGSPIVRPRVLTVKSDERGEHALKRRIESMHTAYTRCGVAMSDGLTTVVTAEVLADLEPLPTRARTGAWLTLEAIVHVPATKATVVVLGPRGAPKTFPTTLDPKGHTRARFALDQPGAFTVQLVADIAGGPRPVLEARVFADVAPSSENARAPGENEPDLERMVATVRREEGLPPLRREPRLDKLAAAHVARMKEAGSVAHDLGDGNLADRFQAEGYAASVVGENVARAETLALAHRALYASPSHRLNLLNAQYTRLGVATLEDGGRTWVCEVFSSDFR